MKLLSKKMKDYKPIGRERVLKEQLRLLNKGKKCSRLAGLRNGEELPLPECSGSVLTLTIIRSMTTLLKRK